MIESKLSTARWPLLEVKAQFLTLSASYLWMPDLTEYIDCSFLPTFVDHFLFRECQADDSPAKNNRFVNCLFRRYVVQHDHLPVLVFLVLSLEVWINHQLPV